MIQEKNINNNNAGYKTLKLIEDLRVEIAKLLPRNQLWGGKLSYDKLSIFLGMNEIYIRTLKNRVINDKYPSYNPDFTFSKDQLSNFTKNITARFGKAKIHRCTHLISNYDNEVEILDY